MRLKSGFTLIEMSIVLVIIGLVIGGILVGQSLIDAATIRSQITQIEKYRTAVNTFRGKYGELPGDMDAQTASTFGFAPRSYSYAGYGNNDGLLQGNQDGYGNGENMVGECGGETLMFWQDLSYAGLIDGGFNSLVNTATAANPTVANINQYVPVAKIGNGNSVFAWSGGWQVGYRNGSTDGHNYFAVVIFSGMDGQGWGSIDTAPGMTVAQAYSMDLKIDDALPQTGNVVAFAPNGNGGGSWAPPSFDFGWGGSCQSASPPACVNGGGPLVTAGSGGSSSTCYDNNNNAAWGTHYSIEQSHGSNVNCFLSFQFE